MEAEEVRELVVRLGLAQAERLFGRLRLAGRQFLGEGEVRKRGEVGQPRAQLLPGDLVDQAPLGLQRGEIERVALGQETRGAEARVGELPGIAVLRVIGIELVHAAQVGDEHQAAVVVPQVLHLDGAGAQDGREVRQAVEAVAVGGDDIGVERAVHPGGLEDLHPGGGVPALADRAVPGVQQDHAARPVQEILRDGEQLLVRGGRRIVVAGLARERAGPPGIGRANRSAAASAGRARSRSSRNVPRARCISAERWSPA